MGKKRRSWSGPDAPDIDEWEAWLAACGMSPATRFNYTGSVRRAARAGALDSPDALTQWLANPQWAVNTRANVTKGVRPYLVWGRARGWKLPHPRYAEQTPSRRPIPRPLTAAEVAAVFGTSGSTRTHDWIRLSMATGLRAGEISRIRADDIDFVAATLHVNGKGARKRVLPLTDVALDILARRPEQGPLWPDATPDTVSHAVCLLFRRAGVRHGGVHRCRHWFATSLLDEGVDIVTIQQLLGHSSIATTQVYLLVRPEGQRAAVNKLTIPAIVAAA